MGSPSPDKGLPSSYNTLPTQHIKLSHVPASSKSPTPVILLTFNRPAKKNAFTEFTMLEFEEVFDMFDRDDRVKAIVLTGSGDAFCAGADLEVGFPKAWRKDGVVRGKEVSRDIDHRDPGGRASLAVYHCRKPTIVAINGAAVGIGITVTLPATIRLACATAQIGFVFSRRGVVLEAASSYFLPRLIGFSRAMHVATTGTLYPASHPLLRDLFSEILPTPEATVARALELAADIAANTSVVSTALMRDLMFRGPPSAEEAHLLDSKIIYGLFGGRDNTEGVKSFFEKRPPEFKGTMEEDAPAAYPWWVPVDTKGKVDLARINTGKPKL